MRIGIDLGGTKIEGIVLAAGGLERARLRIPTPQGSYEAAVAAIVEVIGELERRAGRERLPGHPRCDAPTVRTLQ